MSTQFVFLTWKRSGSDQSVVDKAVNWELKECGGPSCSLLFLQCTLIYLHRHTCIHTPTRAHTHTEYLWWTMMELECIQFRPFKIIFNNRVTALWLYPPSVSVGPPQTFREHTPIIKVDASPYCPLLAFSMLRIQILHIMNLLWLFVQFVHLHKWRGLRYVRKIERSVTTSTVTPWFPTVCLIDSCVPVQREREREVGRGRPTFLFHEEWDSFINVVEIAPWALILLVTG